MVKISPSILACDFANLEQQCSALLENGADMLHIDVMDGHFVNNITLGAPILKSLNRKLPNAYYDVHLMIDEPIKYVEDFALAGANIITFHIEVKENVKSIIKKIKQCNCKVGIALKPSTNINLVYEYLEFLDMVLVMSVEPGFGGQSFIIETLSKIDSLKNKIKELEFNNIDIQVDGGIDNVTSKKCVEQGANVLVSGSYIFKSKSMKNAIESLR